jgi:hypothetical protein
VFWNISFESFTRQSGSSRWFPKSDLGFCYTPTLGGLVSSKGQLGGGYADSSQATLLQGIDLDGKGCGMGEFDSSQLFVPTPLIFKESTYERKEAWFMVFTVEPSHVPTLK